MLSRDSSSNFLLSNDNDSFKHVSAEGSFLKNKELMGSDLFQNQIPQGSGLARIRSAPGSFLASLLESAADNSSSGDDSEALLSAFFNNEPLDLNQKYNNQIQFSMKLEAGAETEFRPGKNSFSSGQMGYEGAVNGSYYVGMGKVNTGSCLNLARQNSSPAGFLSGYGVMGEVGTYNHVEVNSSANGLSNHVNFSSAPSSTPRFMPTIPENRNDGMDSENGQLEYSNRVNGTEYKSPFSQLKRTRDGNLKVFSNISGLENQETGMKSPSLAHQFSLPKTSSEIAEVQKFMHFQQDTVPCQIRAKRGFATHPRSIAERMRRTRISEKMKKLQDLFPNLDKQMNTADMLDLAVEYIKDLQKQVKTLTDTRAKCICSSKRTPTITSN